jgi:hypothetical protein
MPRLGTARFVLLWTGLAIHLLTVYTALRLYGWLEAGLSLVFPFAAQVYWIVDLWERTGVFWNFLTIICLAYAAGWLAIVCLEQRHHSV